MPRRRRHAILEGESPSSRRRRLNVVRNNRRDEHRRSVVPTVSTPEDSPSTRRLRTRRHENRRSRGLPSATPPTPVIVRNELSDLPIK